MTDEEIGEIKRNINHDPAKAVWAKQTFSASDFHHMTRRDDYSEYIKREIDHAAAKNIFNLIRDGKKYVVQAEWFEHLPDSHSEPVQYYFHEAEYTMGYQGHIAEVETLTRREYEFTPPLTFTMPTYRPPTWRELRRGVTSRLQESFAVSGMAKIFHREVIARILYLPDTNPDHWGI